LILERLSRRQFPHLQATRLPLQLPLFRSGGSAALLALSIAACDLSDDAFDRPRQAAWLSGFFAGFFAFALLALQVMVNDRYA
jgi:hypothetical protein